MGNPNPSYGLAFPIKREAAEVEASRPRIRCERCDGADFDDGEDGFFYCRDCGGLSQDMLDTACADEDLFAVGSLYSTKHVRHSQSQSQALPQDKAAEEDALRSLARDPDGRVREEEGPKEFEEGAYQPMDFGSAPCPDEKAMADGIRARYVQGLQLMIQMQCKELVEGFGVSHLICGVAGTVWLRYLTALRVFDEGWADKAIWESEGASRERYEKKDYSKGLGSYLKYCKDVVFAGIKTSYEEERLIESLWDIYEKQEDDDIMTKETGLCNRNRSSDEDNVLMEGKIQRGVEGGKIRRVDVLMNKSSSAHNSHDTRQDDGYADRISEGWMLDNSCMDNSQSDGKHIVTGSSRMDDAKDVEGSRTDGAKHAALTRLKLNMDENGFEYLPPRARRRTGDYLHYRRKKIRGKFHYVAHADYYILLRACAKLAQVDVRIMHLGVLKLERRLSWIEQRISGSLMLFCNECERTSEENKTNHY